MSIRSDNTRKEAVKYAHATSISQAAKKYRVSATCVSNWKRKFGAPEFASTKAVIGRPNSPDAELNSVIFKLRAENTALKCKIADFYLSRENSNVQAQDKIERRGRGVPHERGPKDN